jgi:MFS family permease
MLAYVPSRAGDFLYGVALAVTVYTRTQSATWVAAVAVLTRLPLVLLPPLVGGLADRYNRRSLMVGIDLARAALMGVLAIAVADRASPAVLVTLATLAAVVGTPYGAANAALVPQVVDEDALAAANAVSAALESFALIGGPAIGAAVVLVSPTVAFAVNAATFLLSAACLLRVRVGAPPVRAAGAEGPGLASGVRALFGDPGVLAVSVGVCAACICVGSGNVTFVLVAEQLIGTGANGYGYLLAAAGVGGLLASLVAGRLAEAARMSVVVAVSLAIVAAAAALIAVIRTPLVDYAVLAAFGGSYLLLEILSVTLMQRLVPADRLGRAVGALDAAGFGCVLLGALVAPALVAVSLRFALVALSVPAAVAAVAVAVLGLRVDRAAAAEAGRLRPVVELLRQADALAGAPAGALERLAKAMIEVPFRAGEVVVREGDPADAFYVIRSGRLEVTSAGGRDQPPAHIRVLGPRDCFGELGLLHARPRSATVQSIQDSVVYRASAEDFAAVVGAAPTLATALGTLASTRLERTHPLEPVAAA